MEPAVVSRLAAAAAAMAAAGPLLVGLAEFWLLVLVSVLLRATELAVCCGASVALAAPSAGALSASGRPARLRDRTLTAAISCMVS